VGGNLQVPLWEERNGRRGNGVGKNGGLERAVGGMEKFKMENEKETKAIGNNQKKRNKSCEINEI